MTSVSSLAPVTAVTPLAPSGASSPSGGDFASHLQSAISSVETASAAADRLTSQFVAGENVDLHTVALAGQKASLQFEMFLQVRNKVAQAYQEIMRIQL